MKLSEEWSPGFLVEGYFISYADGALRRYEFISHRELAHYEYTWPEIIAAAAFTGPFTIADLESTETRTQIWQLIFGISHDVYIYTHIPTDKDRHGVAKIARQTSTMRTVGHFEEWMSPWDQPDWCTEHFLLRPITDRIAVSSYNFQDISLKPKLNVFLNKCQLRHIGYEKEGKLFPDKAYYKETLEKLYRKQIIHRPITLKGVEAVAEAP